MHVTHIYIHIYIDVYRQIIHIIRTRHTNTSYVRTYRSYMQTIHTYTSCTMIHASHHGHGYRHGIFILATYPEGKWMTNPTHTDHMYILYLQACRSYIHHTYIHAYTHAYIHTDGTVVYMIHTDHTYIPTIHTGHTYRPYIQVIHTDHINRSYIRPYIQVVHTDHTYRS